MGKKEWAPGAVTMHWFRQGDWPPGMFAPYQVQLDDGRLIFAPDDANVHQGGRLGEGMVLLRGLMREEREVSRRG